MFVKENPDRKTKEKKIYEKPCEKPKVLSYGLDCYIPMFPYYNIVKIEFELFNEVFSSSILHIQENQWTQLKKGLGSVYQNYT